MFFMSQLFRRGLSRTFVASVLVLWFLLVFVGSLLGVFVGNPSQPPLALGAAVILPVIVFLGGWFGSARVQLFIASLDIRAVVFAQIGRMLGGVFLIFYALGGLPGIFALPAGWGDVAIGLTAPLVAWLLVKKSRFRLSVLVLWNVLGMLDLISAVSLGILTSRSTLGVLAGETTSVLVVATPLSLIPTFLVPFYFMLHLIALNQARRYWAHGSQQTLMRSDLPEASFHDAAADGAGNEVTAQDPLPQTHA
jgi:hypothetical protein